MSRLHWIDAGLSGRLAIMARPRAGDWLRDEIDGWSAAGVGRVVCLLEPEEVKELELDREPALCPAAGIAFVSFPILDRGLPASRKSALLLAQSIATAVAQGRSVAVHCRAGIGRSSVIVASALICAGLDADGSLELIKAARGLTVPDTPEQRDWLFDFEAMVRPSRAGL
jgi:protein-tyrosine phosphatase